MLHSPRHVAEVLREAVRTIEQNADVSPDHPDVLALKRIVLEKTALAEAANPDAPPTNQTRSVA